MSDSGRGRDDQDREVSPNTGNEWGGDASFDRVPPDATEKGDGGPHAKRQTQGASSDGHELVSKRGDLSEKIQASKQIANMQEPRRLNRDDLDERRIIYPESPDRNLVNRFRQLRTQLLEVSNNTNF